MKKIILLLVILSSFTSCTRYLNGGGGGCGTWFPKKFEKDRRAQKWTRDASIRNGWGRHY